jgi:hypothetical protein
MDVLSKVKFKPLHFSRDLNSILYGKYTLNFMPLLKQKFTKTWKEHR